MPPGRPAQPYSQAHRLLRMMEVLQTRGQVTIAHVMQEFAVDRRTVQRDMAVLHELYAVEEGERTPDNQKTFRLRPGARQESLKLTLTEMIALYMGKNLFAFTAGTDLERAMASLYDKLQTRLVARNVEIRGSLAKKLYCTTGFPKSYGAADDVLNDLLTGLIEERKVAVTYQVPGKPKYPDVIHPYTLVLHNNALYVVCFSERAKARRVFAVERVHHTAWRNEGSFTYPADYDPARELDNAFGITSGAKAAHVRLRVTAELAPYMLSRRWHKTMKSRPVAGGGVEISMSVAVGEELVHWLTGYGAGVRILAPASLRARVLERHTRACRPPN